MEPVYVKNCNSFGEALNTLKFRIIVPEYYDPNLPNYYKEPIRTDPPVVNGEFVTWEEYYAKYPDRKIDAPKPYIPRTIFKAEDYDLAEAMMTVSDIIDLCDNNVEFTFTRLSDLEYVIALMNGYEQEVYPYIGRHAKLDRFMARLRNARTVISELNEANKNYLDNVSGRKNRTMSLHEILKAML